MVKCGAGLLGSFCLRASFRRRTHKTPIRPARSVQGVPWSLSTHNSSFTFTTSNFFLILPATYPASIATTSNYNIRMALTVNNPNTTSNTVTNHACYLFLGAATSTATSQISIQLKPGDSYHREWPIVPNDALQVYCIAGDSIYVDTQ
jgi:hypothetical protein